MEYQILVTMDKTEKAANKKFERNLNKEIKRGWKTEGSKCTEVKKYKTATMYIISQVIKK